jgi:hypothetical protein
LLAEISSMEYLENIGKPWWLTLRFSMNWIMGKSEGHVCIPSGKLT